MNADERKAYDALVQVSIQRGKIIEVGFAVLRLSVIAPDAPQAQVDDMRMAFMAGAQHLWGSIMTVLEPGNEPSDADMRRMGLISDELDAYAKELSLRIATTGRAQ